MIWLVGGIVLLQTLSLAFLFYISRGFAAKMREYEEAIAERMESYEKIVSDLVQPQGDKPSKLVEFLDVLAANFASRIVGSAEAALRGSAGGVAKAEKAEMIAANPLMGLMGGGRLGKNNLIGAVLQAVLSKIGSGGQGVVPSNGHSESVKFKL